LEKQPRFSCSGCGKCCRELLGMGVTAGLLLLPEEIPLFPDHLIKPCQAKGTHPNDKKKFYLLTLQYTENVCIHLKDNKCMIYNKRPLVCRAFPLQLIDKEEGFVFSPECPEYLKLKNQFGNRFALNMPEEHRQAILYLAEKQREFYTVDSLEMRPWVFNLKTNSWELFRRKKGATS